MVEKNTQLPDMDAIASLAEIPDELRWLSMAHMLVKATTIASQNTFMIQAMKDMLIAKGLITDEELDKLAYEKSHGAIEQLLAMSDDMELQAFRKARELQLKEMLDRRAKEESPQ